jgi:hypothetical protein
MRLTIIPSDGFVNVDGNSKFQPLDLSGCNIPSDVHALQWYETKGWIEFSDDNDPFTPKPANQDITELPEWANACVEVWNNWTPPEPVVPDTIPEA